MSTPRYSLVRVLVPLRVFDLSRAAPAPGVGIVSASLSLFSSVSGVMPCYFLLW